VTARAHSYVDSVSGCVHLTLRGGDAEFEELVRAARLGPREQSFKQDLYLYAWERHRHLVLHEWAHVLQLLSYPALYLRAVRGGKTMVAPAFYLSANPASYPLPLTFQMDEDWALSSLLSTVAVRAVVREDGVELKAVEDSVRRGVLTERDLVEGDATVFQYRAEVAGRGLGRAFRRWLREQPRYTRLFSFLAIHFGDDAALRLLPIMVRVAFRSTRPLDTFFGSFATIMHEGADFFERLEMDDEELEELLFADLRSKHGSVAADKLSMQSPEWEDPYGAIDPETFAEIVRRYPQLPVAPLTKLDLEGEDDQRGVAREALRYPERFFDRRKRSYDPRLQDYLPPAITIALDDPDFPQGSTLLALAPVLGRTQVPGLDGISYSEMTSLWLKSRWVWREILSGKAGPNPKCPHLSCAYNSTGLCRGWIKVPSQPEACEFPDFFAQTTRHRVKADGTTLEPLIAGGKE